MLLRFDPSLLSITVRPKNIQTFPGAEHASGDEGYYVVQGIHSVKALQDLRKEGLLGKVPVLADGLVRFCGLKCIPKFGSKS